MGIGEEGLMAGWPAKTLNSRQASKQAGLDGICADELGIRYWVYMAKELERAKRVR